MSFANLQAAFTRIVADEETPARLRILRSSALAIAPALIASLMLPTRVCVFAVLVTIMTCYRSGLAYQEELFTLRLAPSHFAIAVPLQFLFFAWLFALLLLHRPLQLGATLCSVLLLMLTAIAPLYRRASSARKQRRMPFTVTYSIIAGGVLCIQIYTLWITP